LTECFDKKGSKTGYGPIDPTKPKNFEFMDALLHEVKKTFQDDYLHLGGDEVSFSCWKSNENISNFMKEHKIETYSQLESLWVQGMIDIAQVCFSTFINNRLVNKNGRWYLQHGIIFTFFMQF
jgi:hexosaminidase